MKNEETERLQSFKDEIGNLIQEWYEGCPRPLQFVSKVIKSYKEHFGNDYASKKNTN